MTKPPLYEQDIRQHIHAHLDYYRDKSDGHLEASDVDAEYLVYFLEALLKYTLRKYAWPVDLQGKSLWDIYWPLREKFGTREEGTEYDSEALVQFFLDLVQKEGKLPGTVIQEEVLIFYPSVLNDDPFWELNMAESWYDRGPLIYEYIFWSPHQPSISQTDLLDAFSSERESGETDRKSYEQITLLQAREFVQEFFTWNMTYKPQLKREEKLKREKKAPPELMSRFLEFMGKDFNWYSNAEDPSCPFEYPGHFSGGNLTCYGGDDCTLIGMHKKYLIYMDQFFNTWVES